jgi:uncharacterized protein (DUF2164 family)
MIRKDFRRCDPTLSLQHSLTTPLREPTTSAMLPSFSKEEKLEITASIQRFFREKLDIDLSEMHAGFLLDYFFREIAPFAYNKGIEDARRFFTTATEDVAGTCFQEALTYWKTQASAREVRRKPRD